MVMPARTKPDFVQVVARYFDRYMAVVYVLVVRPKVGMSRLLTCSRRSGFESGEMESHHLDQLSLLVQKDSSSATHLRL